MTNTKIKTIIPIGIILCSILFYLFQTFGLLIFHDNFILSKYLYGDTYKDVPVSDVSFDDKIFYFKRGMTDSLNIALIAGGIFMVWQSFRGERIYLLIVTLLAISFLIYFIPEGMFLRSRFLIPLTSLVIAGGANGIFALCENRFKRIFNLDKKIGYVKLLSAIVVLIIFIPLLYESTTLFRTMVDDTAKKNQVFATFGTSEYDAARWLRENMPRNTVVLSDPYTINLMASLSDFKSPYKRIWIEPKEYPAESLQIMSDIRTKFFLDDNNEEREGFLNEIMTDNDAQSVIIIINSRTATWIGSDKFFIVPYSGIRTVQVPVVESLINLFPAKLVYTDEKTIYVYKYDLSD